MTVSRRLRFEIFRRDDYTCKYCGASPAVTKDVELTVDHVIPVTLGGGDEPTNLATACQPCNAGKSSIPPDAELVEDVASDALRWKRATENVCGTAAGAQRHYRAREPVCEACRLAHNGSQQRSKQTRKEMADA